MQLNLQGFNQSYFLLLLSLVHITAATVYYVVPDDRYPANSSYNTLKHYLTKSEGIFSSNNQVQFLQGRYHLPFDIFLHDMDNFSIIGSNTGGIISTTIYCNTSASISIFDSNNISINSIAIKECGFISEYVDSALYSLIIVRCSYLSIQLTRVICTVHQCGLMTSNTLGTSYVKNISACILYLNFESA